MSNLDDELRRAMHAIGADARPADLTQRSLATARSIRHRRTAAAVSASAVVVAALSVGGWALADRTNKTGGTEPATTNSPTVSPTASPTPTSSLGLVSAVPSAPATPPVSSIPAAPSAAAPTPVSLPILVSAALSTPGQDSSVLHPTSCTVANGVATATGTFGQFYEVYRRYGDAVELYVYTGRPTVSPTTFELAQLPNPSSPPVDSGSWQVSAPITDAAGAPMFCLVAVQSTHAFIGAPAG
jgi:hypothetical protein